MELTIEEFKKKFPSDFGLSVEYGLAYLIVKKVYDITRLEKVVEDAGFTVKRMGEDFMKTGEIFSLILFEGKEVGFIDLQGFPSIQLHKRKRKFAKKFKTDLLIKPIKGVHRVLDWHTVSGYEHRLAGGQTVLHGTPSVFTKELMDEWIIKLGIQELKGL